MKSIIMAVLLVAAVGAGVYFLFLKKKNGIAGNDIQKELIIGKWKLDSLSQSKDAPKLIGGLVTIPDTNLTNYSYQFRQDGKILRLLRDSVQKDTSTYEWTKEQQLVFRQQDDSTATKFMVSKLNQDSLVLLSKDSSIAYFTRFK